MGIAGYTLETIQDFVGCELGTTEWTTIDQHRIDQFADCCGDRQWIHVDLERSRRESPFGTTIAHGYLIVSLLAPFTFEIGAVPPDAAHSINYGLNRVRFVAPVKAGARVRAHVKLLSVEPRTGGGVLATLEHTIEIEGESKPAMVAEVLAMLS